MPCYAIICLEKMNVHRYVKSENVLGRDESRPKPDPQGILLLMQRWGAAEADTVMLVFYVSMLGNKRGNGSDNLILLSGIS